jgi:uncharacterized membrane protein
MERIETLFNRNKRVNQLLLYFSFYCFSLLLVRAKLTQTIYLFFLIWNLILAIIPYLTTSYLLKVHQSLSKTKFFVGILIWLAFIPNSFYILTDLIHLTNSNSPIIWLDVMIISSYAFIGFVFGTLSLVDFENIIKSKISIKFVSIIIPFVCFLCGIGIFIGRILRYNSWDILSNPFELVTDCVFALTTYKSILFSIHFCIIIYFSYLINKIISK